MDFEWDEDKRRANLIKHRLDFVDAPKIFDGFTYTIEDDRDDYGETRYLTFGILRERVVVIAHTERRERIRIISMRKAFKYESNAYFKEIGYGLEGD